MKIGIMGGTFNPIHHGHLILSEYIRTEAGLDKIVFIPTGLPPHKVGEEVLEGRIRLEMVQLAIRNNPYFAWSDMEIRRKETSYTIDTIGELKRLYDKAQLYLIIGADNLLSIHTWKDYKRVLEEVNIIVANRLGSKRLLVVEEIERLNNSLGVNIKNINSPIIEISSTEIRERVRQNKSIKYLVPELVEDYILRNNLYK
ncbi:MAG: nicotinate-nucleotide adenylyltransferase [Tissierellia bacterium]|nr:nicotinate-nucleotide adenylyltransferase [Tissierellia bacterium]